MRERIVSGEGRIAARPAHVSPRGAAISALVLGVLAAGCEHPLPPAGPTPRELMVAEALNVPVSSVQAFERNGVPVPAATRPPDPASREVEHLRRVMASLEKRYHQEDVHP